MERSLTLLLLFEDSTWQSQYEDSVFILPQTFYGGTVKS